MAGAVYTGGREGTHAVTVCKPVGGGVVDVENVPLDQSQLWIDRGYYQCGTTGDEAHTGYCIATPAGQDCQPAPEDVKQTTTSVYIPPANVNVTPARLPAVGSGDLTLLIALAGAALAAFVCKEVGDRRRM